jgi:hypothetical protein
MNQTLLHVSAAVQRQRALARHARTLVEAIDLSLSPPLINAIASCAPHSTCEANVSPASDDDGARLCPFPILSELDLSWSLQLDQPGCRMRVKGAVAMINQPMNPCRYT